MLHVSGITHLTFDCYGTLIDWESGILGVLRPLVEKRSVAASDERLLSLYVEHEAAIESGPYQTYGSVLRGVVDGIADDLGFTASDTERDSLPDSVGSWPPFTDMVAALRRLKSRFSLVILSNIDDAMLAASMRLMEVPFDGAVTAEQVRGYKPNPAHFTTALERYGLTPGSILHVAQSLYHDHGPAKALGFRTVRIDRPSRLSGTGIAPESTATPDATFPDLVSLANSVGV